MAYIKRVIIVSLYLQFSKIKGQTDRLLTAAILQCAIGRVKFSIEIHTYDRGCIGLRLRSGTHTDTNQTHAWLQYLQNNLILIKTAKI
jgi:hypothetical protein